MEIFKIVIIYAYWLFCTVYAVHAMGVADEREPLLFRVLFGLIALLVGPFCAPIFIAEDLYNKLNK